jgi:hypothetical protein
MYFDAVLDENMRAFYNGTPKQVVDWLRKHPEHEKATHVAVGRTMEVLTISEYLEKYGELG